MPQAQTFEARMVAELQVELEAGVLIEVVDCIFRYWAEKCHACRKERAEDEKGSDE